MAGPGDLIDLDIEKPAAGGRMLARLDGQVTLVAGAIPGERVRARIETARGDVLFASTVAVLQPSPDRHDAGGDSACGGRSFAHIAPPRQRALKVEIVRDAFRRIGRMELPADIPVHASPEDGYRMRARLHVSGATIGFYREGTHALCDPASTRQLLPATVATLAQLADRLRSLRITDARSLELAENREASERALYLELAPRGPAIRADALFGIDGVTGFGIARQARPVAATGSAFVSDELALDDGEHRATLRLGRHVTGFFQGNRYLLQTLVERVLARVPPGPLTDLYAGAGLFGLAHAALGRGEVIAVEADTRGSSDLRRNARPFGSVVRVEGRGVEETLKRPGIVAGRTALVDPPRTGLSQQAVAALLAARPSAMVYLSCDPATLARDVRLLADGGLVPVAVEVFDLFPATAHIETLVGLAWRA